MKDLILRIYEPLAIAVSEQDAAQMPTASATAPMTNCLLCSCRTELPPGKLVRMSFGGNVSIGNVCGPCTEQAGDDTELEKRLVAKITAGPESTDPDKMTTANPAQELAAAAVEPAASTNISFPAMAAVELGGAKWVKRAALAWRESAARPPGSAPH
jgi:hypothetical protein